MAQYDWTNIVPTTDTGTTLSTALNKLVPSLYSTHSGNTRPTYVVANQLWVDTTVAANHKLYLFDGTQDQLIASFDPTKINSLRSGDGLSKADGGTVVKPVTFNSIINPKKGVKGRNDAAKAGEIGEIIDRPEQMVYTSPVNVTTGTYTGTPIVVPSDGVFRMEFWTNINSASYSMGVGDASKSLLVSINGSYVFYKSAVSDTEWSTVHVGELGYASLGYVAAGQSIPVDVGIIGAVTGQLTVQLRNLRFIRVG